MPMDSSVSGYASDLDRLLSEILMTAAMYGLEDSVSAIADHLRDLPGKDAAADLGLLLVKISVREFDSAISYAEKVLSNPELVAFHHEAAEFRKLAAQLAAGIQATPLTLVSLE